jgi:hypothetical protein
MSKLYHVVPKEILDALRNADTNAIRAFRATLDGTEQIYIRDTVPILDVMEEHMAPTKSEEERREMARMRARMVESDKKTSMLEACLSLEQTIEESMDQMLLHKSPALYAMKKMVANRYLLPGEVAAALETLRPQLLAPLRNRIKAGEPLSNESYTNIVRVLRDYSNRCYPRVGSAMQQALYDASQRRWNEMIVRSERGEEITVEISLGLIDIVEDVIKDIVHNERAGGGVAVADGQWRGKSIFAALN